jgi:hypothetical protein
MNFNRRSCSTALENTGRCDCQLSQATTARLILTTEAFQFANLAGVTEAAILAGIKAKTVFPLWEVDETIDNTPEDGSFSMPNGMGNIPTSTAEADKVYMMHEGSYLNNKLNSFKGFRGRVYEVDVNNVLWGTSPDGTKFEGMECEVKPTGVKVPTSTGEVERRGVKIRFIRESEYNARRFGVETTWADVIEGLRDVEVSYVSLNEAKTAITVSVVRDCDGTPVLGLAAGDFVLTNDANETVSISSVTASGNNYILAVSALADDGYIVNLATPAAMTTFGYESLGSDTFTVTTS